MPRASYTGEVLRTRLALVSAVSLAGCFSEPPATTGEATSSQGSTGEDDDATSRVGSSGAATETAGTTGGPGTTEGSADSTSGEGTDASSSSTTDTPPPQCECDAEDADFCEDFELLSNDDFGPWAVPNAAGAVPPQIIEDEACGKAFRGSIGAGESFSVIVRPVDNPNPAANPSSTLRGRMRIDDACASMTEHRLFELRFDQDGQTVVSRVGLFTGSRGASIRSVVPPSAPVQSDLEPLPRGAWFEFELVVDQPDVAVPGSILLRIDGGVVLTLEFDSPALVDDIVVSPVLGPFAESDPAMAGCTVDFDNVSLSIADETP